MLVFAGATDGIAPVNAVKAVVPLLTGAAEVRFEIVPGGHLGMLTGRAARGSTWRVLDDWIGQWSTVEETTPAVKTVTRKPAARKATAKKAAPRKAATKTATKKTATKKATKKATTKKTATKKTAAKKPTAGRTATDKPAERPETIGVNPTRRYGSSGSRSLAR